MENWSQYCVDKIRLIVGTNAKITDLFSNFLSIFANVYFCLSPLVFALSPCKHIKYKYWNTLIVLSNRQSTENGYNSIASTLMFRSDDRTIANTYIRTKAQNHNHCTCKVIHKQMYKKDFQG